MVAPCRWATTHWVRFDAIETPDSLDLSRHPRGAASWKFGPDGPIGPDGARLPSAVWCGAALYQERADAERSIDDPAAFLPFLGRAREAWHALLAPIAHRGVCNHLDRAEPCALFPSQGADDPTNAGGPLVVMTTAGFDLGPALDLARVVDFRRNVDRVREVLRHAEGNFAHHAVTAHTYGDDGMTFTVWRDDAAMARFAYGPGFHRDQIARYKAEHTADRTSFTRFRALRTSGQWEGRCPVEAARAAADPGD